jgi:mannitol/fructose-specific phosphotransferase system IIA component (Ntr-type)/biotin operon repressor
MCEGGDFVNKNIQQMLNILLQQDNYLTASQLASMLNVTERSVRNYVRTLNQTGTQEPLIVSSPEGYKLQREIYNQSVKSRLFDQGDLEQLYKIALILIQQRDYMTFDELATRLNYSVESIRSRVQLLFARIDEMDIQVQLDSQIFVGIRIVGNEAQKRLLLEQFLPISSITKDNPSQSITGVLGIVATNERVSTILTVMDKTFAEQSVSMDFVVYAKIACHLVICQWRCEQGWCLDNTTEDNGSRDYPENTLAQELLSGLLPNDVLKGEISSLANYLIALPISIRSTVTPKMDANQRSAIDSVLKMAERNYSVPLYSDEHYRAQITNHITRLINPLTERIPIFNPYTHETKREYLFAYSIACYLYDNLEGQFNVVIPDSEIAYLAIHIQLVLNEETKTTISACLVFNGKAAEAELFRYKLQNYFPEIRINQVESNVKRIALEQYQLVMVCGVDGGDLPEWKTVAVDRGLTPTDVNRIQVFVDTFGTHSLIESLDFYHINQATSTDVIRELVVKAGYGNLLPYLLKREAMSSTDIGNLVALPHPFLKGSEGTAKVIVGINDKPIRWGHQTVQLVIIYIPAADLRTNKTFFDEVYARTSNLELVHRLIRAQDKQTFIQIWNKRGRN